MDEFAARFADLLENTATKIRRLTADRAATAVRGVALGLPAAVLGILAIVFLFMTIHGALAIPLGSGGAFGVLAGLFLLGGWLVWRKRIARSEETS